MAVFGGLVVVLADVDADRHLLDHRLQAAVGGAGVERIHAQEEQRGDPAGADVLDQVGEGVAVARRGHGHRLADQHRRAEVAEAAVDRVDQHLLFGREVLAADHRRAAGTGGEIVRHLLDPGHQVGLEIGGRTGAGHAEAGGEGEQELADLARLDRYPVVGHRAGARGDGLDRVEPAHLPGGVDVERLAAGREVARVGDRHRAVVEEVGIDRQHHVGLGEVEADLARRAEGGAHRGVARAVERLVDVPLGERELRQDLSHQPREGRRGDPPGDQPQAVAAHRPESDAQAVHAAHEGVPGADLAELGDRRGAVRIVEVEDRSLDHRVGAAAARRMLLVAFDLGRPAHVALAQHAEAVALVRRGGGEEERLAGDDVLGLAHVGDDLLRRLLVAGHQAGERQRGAGQLEEAAAVDVAPFRRLARKFALQHVDEARRLRQLVHAAPEIRAFCAFEPGAHVLRRGAVLLGLRESVHRYRLVLSDQRWQVEQLKSLSLPASCTCSARWA